MNLPSDWKSGMQICRGFTTSQWCQLRTRLCARDGRCIDDEQAWQCAIKVFERRIHERFMSCIESLEDADSKADVEVSIDALGDCSTLPSETGQRIVVPGFSIMALCCLMAETLQSFRTKAQPTSSHGPCLYPHGACLRVPPNTTDNLKNFLRRPSFAGAFDDDLVVKSFIRGVRNGSLHEAETRRWVIWRNEPPGKILDKEGRGFALNRTLFYQALRSEFREYLRELGEPKNTDLRLRFLEKMNDIVKEA